MDSPNPVSTSTSAPSFTSFAAVSGMIGTRVSAAAVSFGMKIRIVAGTTRLQWGGPTYLAVSPSDWRVWFTGRQRPRPRFSDFPGDVSLSAQFLEMHDKILT